MTDPKIVFGIMSAGYRPQAVSELADLLAPHPVHVHHDFARFPTGPTLRENMHLVADPIRTGWGTWGFSLGIARLMRSVLRAGAFDYFQLLSPTCLPIRPVQEFVAHVATDPVDAHLSLVDLFGDEDALVEYGFRTFVPGRTVRKRVLGIARELGLGTGRQIEQRAGLAISHPSDRHRDRVSARLARRLIRGAASGLLGAHPFDAGFHPYMGSTWLGAHAPVVDYLVREIERPEVAGYFSRLELTDELLFASLLGNSGFQLGKLNHLINRYGAQGHPLNFGREDLAMLDASDRFFARKFSDSAADPARRWVLARLGRVEAGTGFGAGVDAAMADGRRRVVG